MQERLLNMACAMSNARSPRWFLSEPSVQCVSAFLRSQGGAPFGYAETGRTRENVGPPAGYNLDHNRALLGHGEEAFARARAALEAWRMFPSPWTKISPTHAPLREGQTVAMQAHALGVWWLNACRIVYVFDEADGPVRRHGFAYGTLPAHVETGEERFSVELLEDGTVWYDLRAFSRPRFWPVRLAKPLARTLQRRFVRESKAEMQRAVGEEKALA